MDDQHKPELSADRDALNLVRNRRLTKNAKRHFHLSMPAKISAVALIFIGAVTGVWLMRSSPHVVNEDDLPLLTTEFEGEEFKVAPDEADAFHVPHEDKTLYSEFEPKDQRAIPEKLRTEAEVPHPQVSQEDLMAQAELAPQPSSAPQTQMSVEDQPASEATVAQNHSSATPEAKDFVSKSDPTTAEETITVVESVETHVKEELDQSKQNPNSSYNKSVILALLSKDGKQSDPSSVNSNGQPHLTPAPQALEQNPASALASQATGTTQEGVQKGAKGFEGAFEGANSSGMPQAATLGKAGYWIQLASLPTETAAEKEWNRIQAKCTQDLNQQDHRIMRVDLGKPKGVRYRLQCGPLPRSEAVQKCRSIKSNGVDCLVVKQ